MGKDKPTPVSSGVDPELYEFLTQVCSVNPSDPLIKVCTQNLITSYENILSCQDEDISKLTFENAGQKFPIPPGCIGMIKIIKAFHHYVFICP